MLLCLFSINKEKRKKLCSKLAYGCASLNTQNSTRAKL